jgi:hypothetical protein
VLARIGASGAVASGATAVAAKAGAHAAAGSVAPGAGGIATGAAWTTGSLVAKAVVGVGLAAAVSVGTVSARRAHEVSSAVAQSTPPVVTAPGPSSPGTTGTAPAVVGRDAAATPAKALAEPMLRQPVAPFPVAARVAKTSPGAQTSPSSLVEETTLLRAAHDALVTREPARALETLDAYASRFPHGLLEEEHAGMRAIALCESGRPDAGRSAAEGFFRDHPRSALAARVRQSCGDD